MLLNNRTENMLYIYNWINFDISDIIAHYHQLTADMIYDREIYAVCYVYTSGNVCDWYFGNLYQDRHIRSHHDVKLRHSPSRCVNECFVPHFFKTTK